MEVVLSRDRITKQQVDLIVNCILSDIGAERQGHMEICITPLNTRSHEKEEVDVIVNCIQSDKHLSDRGVSSRRTDIGDEQQGHMEICSTPQVGAIVSSILSDKQLVRSWCIF
ncbi:uncharacterized protein LOC121373566 [Gigantopelta aegis]|uniref:uncharacterized protein LOC121373566 n=1 Tax=Gigantopelta aegis TaxID=1735272 RepID=UPI001B88CBD4|nr:uncharacterized protein LOC121373566 [Gigantopelta aegis]